MLRQYLRCSDVVFVKGAAHSKLYPKDVEPDTKHDLVNPEHPENTDPEHPEKPTRKNRNPLGTEISGTVPGKHGKFSENLQLTIRRHLKGLPTRFLTLQQRP